MPPLSDLALMIQSRYPFIAVETSEEDRLETTLSQVAGDLRVPFFVWTVTNGLHRYGLPNAIYDSQPPLKGLNNVAAMTGEAIFLMKDLHRYLADAAVARKCLDLAPAFGHDRRVIVPDEGVREAVRVGNRSSSDEERDGPPGAPGGWAGRGGAMQRGGLNNARLVGVGFGRHDGRVAIDRLKALPAVPSDCRVWAVSRG